MAAGERARDDAGTRPPRDGGVSDVVVGGLNNHRPPTASSPSGRNFVAQTDFGKTDFSKIAALSSVTITTDPVVRWCWMMTTNRNVVVNCGVVVVPSSPKLGALFAMLMRTAR